jgi:hypothetical protein
VTEAARRLGAARIGVKRVFGLVTILRSAGWLGFHTECDPSQPTGEVTDT